MPTIETIETNGFSLDYFRFGQGKRTLVVLPGLSVQSVMGSAAAIEEAYRLLADDFTIYVLDRRKELPATYSMQDMADDTGAALDALGLERTSIFGASQGGMIAMQIAIARPGQVDKLILGSTSSRITEEQYLRIGEWIALAKAGNAEDLYLAFGKALYPPSTFEDLHEMLTTFAKTATEHDLGRFVKLAESLQGFDVTRDLGAIECAVLVMGDEDDVVLGADASSHIAQNLDGASKVELHLYEGYGHAVYDLAPDYSERMLRFLLAG